MRSDRRYERENRPLPVATIALLSTKMAFTKTVNEFLTSTVQAGIISSRLDFARIQ